MIKCAVESLEWAAIKMGKATLIKWYLLTNFFKLCPERLFNKGIIIKIKSFLILVK